MPWLATNAPFHWPNLFAEFPEPDNEPKCRVIVMGQLVDAFEQQGRHLKLCAVAQTRLLDDGVLELPFEVADGDRHVPVFVYPRATPEAAGGFEAVRAILRSCGEPSPVYFAPTPLPPASPASPLRPFGMDLFSKPEGDLPKGEYAMWWSTTEDPSFADSKTVESIDRAYRGLDGYESYVFAAFLRELEAVGKDVGRVWLPEDEKSIAAEGPEGRPVLMSASQEKGIRFHFHVATTPVLYRSRFWKLFAGYAEERGKGAAERGFPKDPESERYGRPARWWEATRKVGIRHDSGTPAGGVMSLGIYTVGADGAPPKGAKR